jgi:ribosomal protein S27AE
MTENNKNKDLRTPEEPYPVSEDGKHFDNLVWETIVMKNGVPYYQKWFFKKEDFPCGRCGNGVNTVFMATPSGVCRSCTYCGFTEHVASINPDTGDEMAILIEEKVVSVDDAWAIIRAHKIRHPPSNLPKQKGGRKRRIEE